MATKEVDEESTKLLLSRFNQAADDVRMFHSQAQSITESIKWKGVAQTDFQTNIEDWQRGLGRVSDALGRLNESMSYYGSSTADTEETIRGTLRSAAQVDGSWAG